MMGLMLEDRLARAQRQLDDQGRAWARAQDERTRLLAEAFEAGWTDQRVADVLGVKRQRVTVLRQRWALKSSPPAADA